MIAVVSLFAIACRTNAPVEAPEPAPVPAPAPVPPEVAFYGFTVGDLDRSVAFFVDTLGATASTPTEVADAELSVLTGLEGATARRVELTLGDQTVVVAQVAPVGEPAPEAPVSNASDFQHVAIVTRDIDAVYDKVAAAGTVPVSVGGPQTIPMSNPAAGGIRAYYFRDADRRALELIWYPDDKGPEAWHQTEGPLVLGIDHSAIAVRDSERSLTFYRDQVGLAVRGTSFNQGAEQEALSGVDGAVVAITGLGGPDGPGVEFLEYEAPGVIDAPVPAPNDLAWWHTAIRVDDVDAVWAKLVEAGVTTVSERVAECGLCPDGGRAGIVRDPDGHGVLLVQR